MNPAARRNRLQGGRWAGILATALLVSLYARGGAGWVLGFVALVPWLRTLDAERSVAGALIGGWAMSVAYTAAAFAWFGTAIGSYTQLGAPSGIAVLLVSAPLFQPQLLVFALVRHVAGRRHGPLLRAVAAAAAWVATERFVPRLLDDSYGYGLFPALLLRQAADLGGVPGLTLALLLANEAVAAALARRHAGLRALGVPLAVAALAPALLAGYGAVALRALPAGGETLRVALVQPNIVDYERLRREQGAAAVVREVLDTHAAMSYDAIERQHAQAVLWSETVYPTTFGHPKSEAGAAFDREILRIVDAAGVPFVFGTYDRDAAGEYNAAAFVAPGRGLVGFYRKARPFPLTEYVPPWLDGAALRRWLPWAGRWRPGDGARVLPLRLGDGREVPVLPLICRDDVDASLVVDGARLGAQAIVTLSNDSWFTGAPLGARLHLAAAAFRSIETRLPQFRVTTNGYSAVIDATGTVIAGTRMGERALVIGEVPVRDVPSTLVVAWGDWVGRAAVAVLALLAAAAVLQRRRRPAAGASSPVRAASLPADVSVLPPLARGCAALLRAVARAAVLGMVAAFASGEAPLQAKTLAQVRLFAALVLAPELAAWLVVRAFRARAAVEGGMLVFTRGRQRLHIALREIVAVRPWRVPLPGPGAVLRLASGERWPWGVAIEDPWGLARALRSAGAAAAEPAPSRRTAWLVSRLAVRRGWLDRPIAKFALLPLALAVPAFRLHQQIAYGSGIGEYYAFGLPALLRGFALWWAAWAIGVTLCAAVVRAVIEAMTIAVALAHPAAAVGWRRWLERLGLAALYLGLPAWLLVRLLAP